MTKKLFIDPSEVRRRGVIELSNIPLNQYSKTMEEETNNFSKEDLVRIYRDMVIIREFESMLYTIKTTGWYGGISYNYPGPAHLSVGQEASAVGQAYLLDKDDFVFGSHRSHGEILAKGLSAMEKMDAEELIQIMEDYQDGAILDAVKSIHNESTDVRKLAVVFLLYGTLAEIFGRETGFQKGLGGSMHAFFTPFGIYPNNAIVGGSAAIALGAALFKKVNRKKGIVIANIGDGSLGCGVVWEALNMASMGQFRELWEGDYQGGVPIIFNFFNNHYG
ncbi:MAG TPA: dehydrogenase, partial [Firmicutes bacterium]|nr:dehydrogenase [Bacillota bacterium]